VNANTNTNTNSNTNLNSNTNVNANANLNDNTQVNANTAINADTATRITSALGLNLAAAAANGAGLTISNIAQDAIFGRVGFMPGDQLVSIAGQQIASPVQFARYLYTVQPGQRIPVVVMRNGVQQTLYWTPDQQFIAALPQEYRVAYAAAMPAQGPFLGLRLDERQQQAVIVTEVLPNSPAFQAGVRPGDQITAVNRQAVTSPDHFRDTVAQIPPTEPVQLALNRSGEVNVSPIRQTTVILTRDAVPAIPAQPGVVAPVPGRVVDPAAPVVPRGPVRGAIRGAIRGR
jgi:S1-C subfamily serine protease